MKFPILSLLVIAAAIAIPVGAASANGYPANLAVQSGSCASSVQSVQGNSCSANLSVQSYAAPVQQLEVQTYAAPVQQVRVVERVVQPMAVYVQPQ